MACHLFVFYCLYIRYPVKVFVPGDKLETGNYIALHS